MSCAAAVTVLLVPVSVMMVQQPSLQSSGSVLGGAAPGQVVDSRVKKPTTTGPKTININKYTITPDHISEILSCTDWSTSENGTVVSECFFVVALIAPIVSSALPFSWIFPHTHSAAVKPTMRRQLAPVPHPPHSSASRAGL